ncbi:MAG: DNA methyltransferase [Limisphaerales bacterium]
MQATFDLGEEPDAQITQVSGKQLHDQLAAFDEFGSSTIVEKSSGVPVYVNEFWTAKQRAAHSVHEVSYRACFKPQLPRFFIERLTEVGDLVLDPFTGRGTTLIESVLLNRRAVGNDVNPISSMLVVPRVTPPTLQAVGERLAALDLSEAEETPEDLLTFYHPDTLREICALRDHLGKHDTDIVDRWIRMTATNRLTGHSPGFFSVYTMPPNQAVTVDRQKLINEKRKQTPEYRDIKKLMLRKSKSLLKDVTPNNELSFDRYGDGTKVAVGSADALRHIDDGNVSLVVTSPPFLDVVQYATDNWLRCWFNGIDADTIPIWNFRKADDWQAAMTKVFAELHRVLKPGGHVAFEVGEVKGGKVKLEDYVIPAGIDGGLEPELVLINAQEFTKTANCWGVDNQTKGTNTNRIVLFQKR